MTTTPGSPCWIELVTPDRDKAVAFYGALFGWTTTEPDEQFGGYSQWMLDGRPIGGLMPEVPGMTGAPTWTVYLATPDVEKTAALAAEHGGSVIAPPMQLPGLGAMVVVADASGVAHSGWQAAPFEGTESVDGPGDPVWHEAYSKDYATTRSFLRDVFSWDIHEQEDGEDFLYATNAPMETATAGLMDATSFGDDFTPAWTAYVKVDDMDATVAKVAELGGSVTEGPDHTPYGVLATIVDPNGQPIKAIVPPAAP